MFGYIKTTNKTQLDHPLKNTCTEVPRVPQTKRTPGLPLKLTYVLFALFFVLCFGQNSSPSFARAETAGWDTLSDTCKERLFPISSGGSKDEMVSCTVLDEKNGLIIVAGNSSSQDYAPAANDHAFAYAVDLDGNWRWGKFFYNVSFAISTISGCQMDANNNLVMLGQGDSKPVIMELNPATGLVTKFMSLEMIGTTSDNQPWYKTFGGIYHDTTDTFETSKSFYYVAFVMSDYTQLMKIDSNSNPATSSPPKHDIRWNYEFKDNSVDVWKNKKTPRYLHQDLNDPTRMYLLGRHRGKASIIKFDKQSAQVDWRLEVNLNGDDTTPNSKMTDILAYVQPEGQRYIFACGYAFGDAVQEQTNKKAVVLKVSDRGQVQYMYSWGENLIDQPDNCRSITWDKKKNEVVLLLEATSPGLRPDYSKYSAYSSKNADTVIVIMKDGGSIQYGYNINMYDASVTMYLAENSMFVLDNHYVFSGQSFGYCTRMQNVTYSIASPTFDSYLFKYNPSDSSCLYTAQVSNSDLKSATVFENVDIRSNTKLVSRDNLFGNAFDNFIAYSSSYAGAFDLGDTMKYPRMCASESINMTGGNGTGGVQYYKGQHEKSYWIGRQSNASNAINKMEMGVTWMFQNGTSAEGLIGKYNATEKTIWIQTDSNDAIGKSRTLLRGCSHFKKLYEVYLYIEVLSNTYPDFITEVKTSWTLEVNQVDTYTLPELNDKEGNDEPVVYIKAMDNQEYPPFLSYNNYSHVLTFRPDSVWYAGLTYYFSIVVKEKHSDTVLYPYYCTVKVNGTEPDRLEGLEFTDITFKMTPITRNSTGAIIFSNPVNLTFVKENWDALFDVYIKNVTFRQHNTTYPLLDFEFTSLGGEHGNDSMTMNFTATFDEPYMLGLLVKKSDKLYVHMKYDLLDTYGYFKPDKQYFNGMVLGNVSLTRFMKEFCEKDQLEDKNPNNPLGSTKNRENMYDWKRIDLQFDFRNDFMIYMREYAKKCYWYLLGIIVFQFFMLYFKDIGFLPLWTLIEYMQLCAFIPLYNFRLIPYLYDTFKPFLVSHLVLSNKAYILTDMEDDYFNINYDHYWLNVAKLGQALALMCALFAFTVLINIAFFVLWLVASKESKFGMWVGKQLSQFRFNAYIRLYMLMYFDLTFFSVMKLVENNDSTPSRRMATIASYVIITLSCVIPFFLMSIICKRFEVMKIKQAKASFNTVVLKIDKQSRWRLIVPGYFFFRRLLTAVLLSMPIENTFIFLQYVFILMSSHAYVLYLVAIKPYQSPLLNNYVLSNETFYSALIIAIFIFSDATPELQIKVAAAVVLIASVFMLIFANLVMIIVMMYKGPEKLKEEIKQAKLKRAEKELIEEEEEEERRQRQQREEEEFTRLPEDNAQLNNYDLAADETVTDMMKSKKRKDKKKSKKKNKNNNDDVQEFTTQGGVTQGNTSEMGNTTQGMLNETTEPLADKKKKDKKKRKDKKKNKQDDVEEANLGNKEKPEGESPTASSENKKSGSTGSGSGSGGGTPQSNDNKNPQSQ